MHADYSVIKSWCPLLVQLIHMKAVERTYLKMKAFVSLSVTSSTISGQFCWLPRSRMRIVAISRTHRPNAKMSTDRVYWFPLPPPFGRTPTEYKLS